MKKYLSCIEASLASFYKRIICNTAIPTRQLAFYRIAIGLFFLIFRNGYSWLAEVPPGFYKPMVLTPARLFDELPPPLYFQVTDYLIALLLIFLILGVKTQITAVFIFLILIISNAFTYSFGKIDHSIMSSLIFLFLAFTNAGTRYALVPDKNISIKIQNTAFAVFALSLVFALFTAGYEKMLNWVDFDLSTSGVLSWFYSGYFDLGRNKLLADYFFYAPAWLTEAMDYSAVSFEISGVFLLYYSRKSWHLFLIIGASFHLFNTLILNISFINHFIVYGLWILSPVFLRKKYLLIIFATGLFLKGLYLSVALWLPFLTMAIYGWRKESFQ